MYVAMFPQLIAGPIVRYSDIAVSLKNRKTTLTDVSEGIVRFSVGLAKKILLANSAALIVAEFKAYDEKTVLFYWLYAAAYMLHIYFDFSGYSDMAIGLGRIFGFRFAKISITRIFQQVLRSFGAVGTFLWAVGFVIIFIFPSEETA